MPGRLFVIPSTLGDLAPVETLPAATLAALHTLDYLVVESPKPARRFLARAGVRLSQRDIHFSVLNEHTKARDIPELLNPARAGHDLGVLSDAGCPGIADPGAPLVRLAHAENIPVMPLTGPSAIMLALMGSGLNGQRFAFHGYLPVESAARARALRTLEQHATTLDQTQILIETPYRNDKLVAAMLATCQPQTMLCIAADLTLPEQFIHTRRIAEWRRTVPAFDRRPSVFLLAAGT
jgi:16S rRNA (cytidine1402-2'-O)-methyltransferase